MRIIEVITIIIYGTVGVISLIMAFKNMFAISYLPFQEEAASLAWVKIDYRLRSVILGLLRISGLGFLVTAMLLLFFPIANYFVQNDFIKYSIPVISFIFCTGLCLVNYKLYKQTNSKTPWKGSLFAMIALIVGLILSVLQ